MPEIVTGFNASICCNSNNILKLPIVVIYINDAIHERFLWEVNRKKAFTFVYFFAYFSIYDYKIWMAVDVICSVSVAILYFFMCKKYSRYISLCATVFPLYIELLHFQSLAVC